MNWYKNQPINKKLVLGFLSVGILTLFVGAQGIYTAWKQSAAVAHTYEYTIQPLSNLVELEGKWQRMRINLTALFDADSPQERARLADNVRQLQSELEEENDQLEARIDKDAVRQAFDTYLEQLQAYVPIRDRMMKLALAGRDEEAEVLNEEGLSAASEVTASLRDLKDEKVAFAEEQNEAATQTAATSSFIQIGILLIALALAVALGLWIASLIGRPLNRLAETAEKIASGDLEANLDYEWSDEIGKVVSANHRMVAAIKALVDEATVLSGEAANGNLKARGDVSAHRGGYRSVIEGMNGVFATIAAPLQEARKVVSKMATGDLTVRMRGDYKGDLLELKEALNESVHKIGQTLSQVQATVNEVNAGSRQVAEASQSLSEASNQQASSVQETSSAVEEIGEQTRSTSDHAGEASKLARNFQAASVRGDEEMTQLTSAMSDIDQSSQDISAIIKVIDEIAFQTNLLALNAAVEAARAGRHGKGFAVVAEEVQNLAARSAEAAKETAELIEGAVSNAKNGSESSARTAEVLKEVATGSSRVTQMMEQIAGAATEQATAVSQVNTALTQIDQVTQQNSAAIEESASAAEELASQAAQLEHMLARFALAGGQESAPVSAPSRSSGDGAPEELAIEANVRPADVIRLDDDEFGRF